jgi:hypothetical protein
MYLQAKQWSHCQNFTECNLFNFYLMAVFILYLYQPYEPGYPSRYSDRLWTGLLKGCSWSPGRVQNFLFSSSSKLALGPTQPLIQWVPGASSPGAKRPGREADHSPRTNTEIKKMWLCTSVPHTPSRLSA